MKRVFCEKGGGEGGKDDNGHGNGMRTVVSSIQEQREGGRGEEGEERREREGRGKGRGAGKEEDAKGIWKGVALVTKAHPCDAMRSVA